MPEILTVDEVAKRVKVTPRTVRSWLTETDEAKRLNSFLLGGSRRIDERDLEDFIERQKQLSQPKKAS